MDIQSFIVDDNVGQNVWPILFFFTISPYIYKNCNLGRPGKTVNCVKVSRMFCIWQIFQALVHASICTLHIN